jgi:cation:H+ antiporter
LIGAAPLVALIGILGVLGGWIWTTAAPDSVAAKLVFAGFEVMTVSIVIWQSCDPFADAAQYFGERWRIPSSVRGATLDAVASSLPELFTGLFFVMVALTAPGDGTAAHHSANGSSGFGATIATCAGSAVYNMILIPAFCGIAIAKTRLRKPIINIEKKVITRDGFWFLVCEVVLVAFLFSERVSWHLAAVLISLYAIYLIWLWLDARRYRVARRNTIEELRHQTDRSDEAIRNALKLHGITPTDNLIHYVRRQLGLEVDGEEEYQHTDSAELLFGWIEVPLSSATGYSILAGSTMITAAACYWLVEATLSIADTLQIPIFFVAVIVAAAASSVPDTLLSIAAAHRGDDDGAVSNAFGSNIFDICICLSVPLLAGIYLNDGNPIELKIDGKSMPGLFGLQVLLLTLSAVTIGILAFGLKLTLRKSYILVALYVLFIGYAVAGSLGL